MEKEIIEAGQEERQLAINRGDFHQGIPATTVIADGGWSKRTHKHTYNAAGGVAIVVGMYTQKILHIGVRNKTCYLCTLYESKPDPCPEHTCYKNWSESSQAMEADIIIEAFKVCEAKHGLRYMRLVADGDASTFVKIQEQIPVWGREVQKLECANHAVKCLR